jgi:nicotinate dehydrogenase subunit B
MSDRASRQSHESAVEVERYELTAAPAYSFALERRQFLQLSGGALVVAVLASRSAAQPQQGRGGAPATDDDVDAWLQVTPDGRVTVFTGKVEVGQNIRTSLAQTVADELAVPFERITMVMGDTDRTPFDNGTFGSQSTPRMAPQLARAARSAREMLVTRAAAIWSVDAATLAAEDGRVRGPDGRSLTFGDLVRDQQLRGAVTGEAAPAPHAEWRERGTSRSKVDARDYVTGTHRFPSDIDRPGLLHGRVIRPERYGAVAVSVDLSAARAMPGVVAVHDDTFIGVAAPSPHLLARAVDAVRVTWRHEEGLPTSETLFDVLRTTRGTASQGGGASPQITGRGAAALADAARTVRRTFHIPYIAHVPLEPRAAVAEWTDDGRVTVWTGTQRPFGVRRELAQAFRMPEDRVRVIMPDTGSGYGGKHTGEQAIEAARLARAAKRPVRLVWTRAEEFMWAYMRPAGVIEAAAGLDADGQLVAWSFDNWNSGGAGIRTPYDVPHQAITFHPSDSPLRQGSYRALAATANNHAREMLMDEAARLVGEDPLAWRVKHLAGGDSRVSRSSSGTPSIPVRLRGVLGAVATEVGWPVTAPAGRAWGIACGSEKNSVVATAAEVSRTRDGFRVERLVTAFECGAIINPEGVRHQVEGAVVQGLGGALFEEVRFADGRLLNGSLSQYRVPRFADMPAIDILLLDRPGQPSDGAGETPIITVAPAIGSAVRAFGPVADALPVRLVQQA